MNQYSHQVQDIYSQETRNTYLILLDNELGRGSYSKVYACQRKGDSNYKYAVKIINLRQQGIAKSIDIERKVYQLLKKSNAVNVLLAVDYIEDLSNRENLYIVLPICKTDLLSHMQQIKWQVNQLQAVQIMRQIAQGVYELHSRGIAHRDIKPENILLIESATQSGEFTYQICDFGTCFFASEDRNLAESMIGTINYMAPDYFNQQNYDPFKADIWSLGILFDEILNQGSQFYAGIMPKAVSELILNKEYTVRCNHSVHKLTVHLLTHMLNKNVQSRYDIFQCVKALEMLEQKLKTNDDSFQDSQILSSQSLDEVNRTASYIKFEQLTPQTHMQTTINILNQSPSFPNRVNSVNLLSSPTDQKLNTPVGYKNSPEDGQKIKKVENFDSQLNQSKISFYYAGERRSQIVQDEEQLKNLFRQNSQSSQYRFSDQFAQQQEVQQKQSSTTFTNSYSPDSTNCRVNQKAEYQTNNKQAYQRVDEDPKNDSVRTQAAGENNSDNHGGVYRIQINNNLQVSQQLSDQSNKKFSEENSRLRNSQANSAKEVSPFSTERYSVPHSTSLNTQNEERLQTLLSQATKNTPKKITTSDERMSGENYVQKQQNSNNLLLQQGIDTKVAGNSSDQRQQPTYAAQFNQQYNNKTSEDQKDLMQVNKNVSQVSSTQASSSVQPSNYNSPFQNYQAQTKTNDNEEIISQICQQYLAQIQLYEKYLAALELMKKQVKQVVREEFDRYREKCENAKEKKIAELMRLAEQHNQKAQKHLFKIYDRVKKMLQDIQANKDVAQQDLENLDKDSENVLQMFDNQAEAYLKQWELQQAKDIIQSSDPQQLYNSTTEKVDKIFQEYK